MADNLHVCAAPIVGASRILKQTQSVARTGLFGNVIICGTAREDLPRREDLADGRRIERVGAVTGSRQEGVLGRVLEQVSWSIAVFRRYSRDRIGAVNAHSVAVLPVCYLLSRRLGARLIYDAHELETETIASRGLQRVMFKVIERLLITRCDAMFVVSDSIAQWYRQRYPALRPVVIRNIPSVAGTGEPADLRTRLGVPAGELLFIHVGHVSPGRNIPAILEAFASPAVAAHVVFLGGGQFEPLVRAYAAEHANIHLLPAVPQAEVVSQVAGCDVGLCLIELGCLSYAFALPNKSFEYTVAGVPFFFSGLPEVSRILGPEFDGWRIADPARDLVGAVAALDAGTVEKASARLAEITLPSWDDEAEAMVAAYVRLMRPVRDDVHDHLGQDAVDHH
jgi:glycosyltransferase involved in cell wall biosynthesis